MRPISEKTVHKIKKRKCSRKIPSQGKYEERRILNTERFDVKRTQRQRKEHKDLKG
jgi:hypothetical protein